MKNAKIFAGVLTTNEKNRQIQIRKGILDMKYIIFDLDGTLIDSMPTWHGTGAAFLEKHGFAVPEDIHDVVKTLTLYQTAEYFRHDLGVPFDAQQIVDEITSYVTDAYKYTIPLRPSAKEYLEAMAKKGVKMCILTASEAWYIQPALDRLDIRKYFDCILTCTELGVYKDDGKAFLTAMEKMGGTLEETAVFEDALYAVRGAKAAGFRVYAILDKDFRGQADVDKITALADCSFRDYKELL